jgi:hypothetical protein
MIRPKILPAILVVVSAVTVLTARASLSEPQAQECKAAPGASTPRGSHWHYRINRTDKQRCWYLSPADARANGRGTASLASTPVPARQKRNASQALSAEPPQTAAAESATGDTASAQAAPAEIAFLRPSSEMNEGRPGFGARWPDNLANAQDMSAQDLEETAPPPPSNSYAETRAEADATQMPLRWPGVETSRAELVSDVETVLRLFSVAGGFLMVALLLAGWAARFVRGPEGWHFADRWRAIAAPIGLPRRQDDFAEIVEDGHDETGDAGTPTDPAHDLKTSLAELMRDLQRAEAASGSLRLAERRGSRLRDDAKHQALQAAE